MSDYHESTIALSLYNVAAIGLASTLVEARAVMARQGMLVALNELEDAADELVERKLMVRDGERYAVTGPAGHVVTSRDRDGDGWGDWRITPYRPRQSALLEPTRIGGP